MQIISHLGEFFLALGFGLLLGVIIKKLDNLFQVQKMILQRLALRDHRSAYEEAIKREAYEDAEKILEQMEKITSL